MTAPDLDHGWQLTGTSADAYEQLLVPALRAMGARTRRPGRSPPGEHVLDDVKVCRFPSVAEFLRYEVLASPLAEPVGRLDPEARDALVADLEDLLAAYVDDDGLALPAESYVVLATNGLRTGEVQGADVEGKRGPGRR